MSERILHLQNVKVSFDTIEHLSDPRGFLGRVHRVLRPDGLLVVSAPNALQFSRARAARPNEFHLSEPTYDEFTAWLEPGFNIREQWEQAPVMPCLGDAAQQEWGRQQQLRRLKVRRFAAAALLWMETGENALRRLLGKELPSVPALEPDETVVLNLSEIFPLLPERRGICPQFLFVCQRRADDSSPVAL